MASYNRSITQILPFDDPTVTNKAYGNIDDLLEFEETHSHNVSLLSVNDNILLVQTFTNSSLTIVVSQTLTFTTRTKRSSTKAVTDIISFIETINPVEFGDILNFHDSFSFSRRIVVNDDFSLDLIDSFTFSGVRGGKITDHLSFSQSAIPLTKPTKCN